jgi:hypothetical protein
MGHNLSGDILTSLNTRVPSPLAGKGQEEGERRLEHDSTAPISAHLRAIMSVEAALLECGSEAPAFGRRSPASPAVCPKRGLGRSKRKHGLRTPQLLRVSQSSLCQRLCFPGLLLPSSSPTDSPRSRRSVVVYHKLLNHKLSLCRAWSCQAVVSG